MKHYLSIAFFLFVVGFAFVKLFGVISTTQTNVQRSIQGWEHGQ